MNDTLAKLISLVSWPNSCLLQHISWRPPQRPCLGNGMTIKIVLADTHQIIRRGLALLLAGEPDMHVVGEAGDYCTTIKLIQEFSPR